MALSPHAHLSLTAPSRWGCKGHCPALRQQMSTVPCHDPPVTMSLVGNLICSRTPDFTCSLTRSRQAPLPEVCWCLTKGKTPLLPHYISLPKVRKRHGFSHHWDGLGLGALPKTWVQGRDHPSSRTVNSRKANCGSLGNWEWQRVKSYFRNDLATTPCVEMLPSPRFSSDYKINIHIKI